MSELAVRRALTVAAAQADAAVLGLELAAIAGGLVAVAMAALLPHDGTPLYSATRLFGYFGASVGFGAFFGAGDKETVGHGGAELA